MLEGSNLLQALRPEDLAVIEPMVTEIQLSSGHTLYEPDSIVDYCYFPRGSAIGSYFVMLDGAVPVETMMVGREGALGGIVSKGQLPAFARAQVMHRGSFFRISLDDLERAKDRSPAIRNLFTRYADCVMAQVFQSIACNASHSIEQRAARWLTAAVARTGEKDITMTQEQLASMMGIGRSYASRVVQRFKRDGLLRTRRGGIEVLDNDSLSDRACTCNHQVRQHFDAVLRGVYPR